MSLWGEVFLIELVLLVLLVLEEKLEKKFF